MLPVHIHQTGELVQVGGLERFAAFDANLFDEMEIVDHRLIVLFALVILLTEDGAGRTRVAGEEEHQVVFEIVERLGGYAQGPSLHLVIWMKSEAGEPAVRGDVLVLLADGFTQTADLHFAGLLGKI